MKKGAFLCLQNISFRNNTFYVYHCKIYLQFLLLAQYVCSMDIAAELPKSDTLASVGFVLASSRTAAFVTLLAKVSDSTVQKHNNVNLSL